MAEVTGYKAKLCSQFMTSKVCESGPECVYAHGKRELRTLENPLYKSQLCTAFTQNGYCQLHGDCLFAHCNTEIRTDEDDEGPTNCSTSVTAASVTASVFSGAEKMCTPQPALLARLTGIPAVPSLPSNLQAGIVNNRVRGDGSNAPPCHAYQKNGFCNRGLHCPYSHIKPDPAHMSPRDHISDAESKYKTALCHAFQKNGKCANGDSCRYAHGIDDLQPLPEKPPVPALDPSDPKYKTKLCIKFEKEKRCVNGDKCNFAHGVEEMRRTPRPGLGAEPMTEQEQKLSERYKTSICQVFVEKFLCPRGPNCTYAHGRFELRPVGFKGDFEAKIAENPRWKCNLCKVFVETQRCKNLDECSYAHGEKELRSEKPGPPEVRRFKTELCKKLFTTGFCPQGSICTFAHSNEDLQQQRMASGMPSPVASGSSASSSGMGGSNNGGNGAFSLFSSSNDFIAGSPATVGVAGGGGLNMGINPRTGVFEQPKLSTSLPQPIGTKPNKDVEMFSDFLEFMKLKESGILDMLKSTSSGAGSSGGAGLFPPGASLGGATGSLHQGMGPAAASGGMSSSSSLYGALYNPLAGLGGGGGAGTPSGGSLGSPLGGPHMGSGSTGASGAHTGFVDLPNLAATSQMPYMQAFSNPKSY